MFSFALWVADFRIIILLGNSNSLISCCNTLMTLLFHSHSNSNSYYHLNTCIIKVLCLSTFWIIYLCYKRLIQRKAIRFSNCCTIYLFSISRIHQKSMCWLKQSAYSHTSVHVQDIFPSTWWREKGRGRAQERRWSIFTFGSISKKFPEQQVLVIHNPEIIASQTEMSKYNI